MKWDAAADPQCLATAMMPNFHRKRRNRRIPGFGSSLRKKINVAVSRITTWGMGKGMGRSGASMGRAVVCLGSLESQILGSNSGGDDLLAND